MYTPANHDLSPSEYSAAIRPTSDLPAIPRPGADDAPPTVGRDDDPAELIRQTPDAIAAALKRSIDAVRREASQLLAHLGLPGDLAPYPRVTPIAASHAPAAIDLHDCGGDQPGAEQWTLMSTAGLNLLAHPAAQEAESARLLFIGAMIIAYDRSTDLVNAPRTFHVLDRPCTDRLTRYEGMAIDVATLRALHGDMDITPHGGRCAVRFEGDGFVFTEAGTAQASMWRNIILNTVFADGLERINRRMLRLAQGFSDRDSIDDAVRIVLDQILREHGWALVASPESSSTTAEQIERAIVAMQGSTSQAMFARHQVMDETQLTQHLDLMVERYVAQARSWASRLVHNARWTIMPHAVQCLTRLRADGARTDEADRLDCTIDDLAELTHRVSHGVASLTGDSIRQAGQIAAELHSDLTRLAALESHLRASLGDPPATGLMEANSADD